MKEIPIGSSDEMTITVSRDMCITHLGPDVAMYSTPSMIQHMEQLCVRLLSKYLDPDEGSVGYRVDVRHLAPTSLGQEVTVKAQVSEVDGRKCLFGVEAYNDTGAKIGEGLHERRVIDLARFRGKKE